MIEEKSFILYDHILVYVIYVGWGGS